MNKILAKICGITNVEDARWAVNFGADFIGLNFCSESPRKVSSSKAKEIVESLPPFVKSVGVFVNPDINDLKKILKTVKFSVLQLHGDEPPALLHEIKLSFQVLTWKAIRVKEENDLIKINDFVGVADIVLLDAFIEDQLGGTGQTFNWDLAVKAKGYGIPIFIAGGLTPENLEDAIEKVEPIGVDVASGVEKQDHPRKKDVDKMKSFLQIAKGVKI